MSSSGLKRERSPISFLDLNEHTCLINRSLLEIRRLFFFKKTNFTASDYAQCEVYEKKQLFKPLNDIAQCIPSLVVCYSLINF